MLVQPKSLLLAPKAPGPSQEAESWQWYLECGLGGLKLWECGGHGLGLLELFLMDSEHFLSPLCAADYQTNGLEPEGTARMRVGVGGVWLTLVVTGFREKNRGLRERV